MAHANNDLVSYLKYIMSMALFGISILDYTRNVASRSACIDR